ncbi:Acyl CoA:acetate/3-ketoacid CoA transferase [Candidatus Hepatincolaceae symbiont of Richtersius coronifer]
MAEFISATKVAGLIKDNSTIAVSGYIGAVVAEEIFTAIEDRFKESQAPKALTIIHGAGIGDGDSKGMNHFAHEGLVKRIIGAHWGLAPKLQPLVAENKIEAYSLPEGPIVHLFRETAAKRPRLITHIGLGTFADPDHGGGKLNEITTEDIVEKIEIDGKKYLSYKTFKLDYAILRGTFADELGNITLDEEALTLNVTAIAMAVKNNNGKVIVQVKSKVKANSLPPKSVKIPGVLVDYVVVVADDKNHMQTFGTKYNHNLLLPNSMVQEQLSKLPLDERKIVAKRAAKLISSTDKVMNYGIGLPEYVAMVLKEQSQGSKSISDLTSTIDAGVFGGIPLVGLDFGTAIGAQAVLDEPYMFDFYSGGGIDIAFLGMAQCDFMGNVNASKFGPKIAGYGGFIDIAQNAKTLVYCSTFTAGKLKVQAKEGKLAIVQEGLNKKFLKEIEQITFSGISAIAIQQKVYFVTERAVFKLEPEGLTLIEIAPRVDLQRDVLDLMEFKPIIAKSLKDMDADIFIDL